MTCKRLSRCYVCKRVLPGQARNRPRIRLKCYFFLPFPAGTRIATSRGGCPAPRNDMLKGVRCLRVQGRFPAVPPGKRRHAANFWMSLRGAERRGNPYSLRQRKTKSSTLGESEKRYEFALRITNLQSFSAGTRIATSRGGCPAPRNDMQKEGRVRGCKDVVRNGMLKTGRCARGQGPAAGSVKTGPSPREITKKYRAVSP